MFICFILSIINLTSAQSGICGETSSDCSWQIDYITKKLVITGNGKMSNYTSTSSPWHLYCQNMPITIEGVTSIGNSAFRECTSLQSITIFDSVTSIGDGAFERCTSLQSITIPDSVTSIGDGAFGDCSSLQSITIPNGVTSIGDFAFSSCKSLQSITIPNSVTSIGYGTFSYCTSLQNITIPNSVTSIGDFAFSSCKSLQSITLPNSVTSIGDFAFLSCKSLQNITIPNSVNSIGDSAFYYCTSLQSITIPNGVTSIGEQAFRKCTSLQSITIPDSVTSIGNWAFQECTSLQNITIPNSVTSIGSHAFYNCRNIESFIIDGYVDEVNEYAFYFNGNIYVNFEYHSNSSPQNCSSVDPSNNTMLLPIFSENIRFINVPKNYESNVFCSCDKYGCPIQYVNNNEYDKIKQASVPIEKTLDETNALYCSYEKGSEIYFYANCDECSCPSFGTSISGHLCNMGDLIIYSKVVVNVTNAYQVYVFGNSTNSFIANELIINLEQQITSYSPYFVFNYLQNDLPLTINSYYPLNNILFYFNMGNSPTRIFGNVDGLTIRNTDNLIYNLPRQRTFFGNAIDSTTYPHLDFYSNYFDYGISSFGDKFASTSSNVVKVSCGGMYRYYSYNPTEIKINSITATCNKTFNENDDDDFDSFIVTSKLSLLSNYHYLFLSSSNIIVESINDGYNQYIYTYPNMFYKYNSLNKTIIYLYGTNERKNKIRFRISFSASKIETSTSIMEIQNEDKTLSTYIIATSKPMFPVQFDTFTETETIKSQVMLIGLENQKISTTNRLSGVISQY